jgi:hypothetical protein
MTSITTLTDLEDFRALLESWLLGLPGMNALIGARIWRTRRQDMPVAGNAYPYVLLGLSFRFTGPYPIGETPFAALVTAYGGETQKIDAIPQVIRLALLGSGETGNADAFRALSGPTVRCLKLRLTEIGPDVDHYHLLDGSYFCHSVTVRLEGEIAPNFS